MIPHTLTKSPTKPTKPTDQSPSFAHFADHAPTAYALYHPNLARLAYYNHAFLQLLHCDAYALEDLFPGLSLGLTDARAIERWHEHVQRLQRHQHSSLEWELTTRYGDHRTLKIDLWPLAGSTIGLIGLKVEDISEWKKLTRESRRYTKII
ncbi:MAG: hypothetical protein AAFR05_19580 [Bacteroidota bacterium]